MKVETVNVYLVTTGKLHPVVVEIVTDEGIAGIGEAAIAYGLGGTAAAGMLKDLGERMIVGSDPARIESLWSEMYDHSFWAKGGGPIVFAAISADRAGTVGHQGQGARRSRLRAARRQDEGQCPGLRQRLVRGRQDAGAIRASGRAAAARGYRALKCYPLPSRTRTGLRHVSARMVDRAFANLAFEKVKALRAAVGRGVSSCWT
jgi:galactonate dehydratase